MNAVQRPSRARRHGLTLIESTIAMLVLSTVLISVMQGVALSVKFQHRTDEELRGAMLAGELAERIAGYDYMEISAMVNNSLGRDSGELEGRPETFDDVDDWDGYAESPPKTADGTDMGFLSGWTREVSVGWVSSSSPAAAAGVEDGAKLITVVVKRPDGVEVGRVRRVVYQTVGMGGD